MPEHDEQKLQPPLFARFSRGRQVFAVLVIPILFGVLAGLTLRWSAPAWWTLQAIGVLGAFVAGREHLLRRSAAVRGFVAGLIAAAVIIGVRSLTPGVDTVSFDLVSFPLIAATASAGLHAGGTVLRRRAT